MRTRRVGRRPRAARRGLLLVVVLAVAAACGTTVPTSNTAADGTSELGIGDPTATTGPTTDGPGTGATGGPGALPPGTSPDGGPSGQDPRLPGAQPTGGPGLPPAASRLGPGITEDKISIGLIYCSDCASANASLGAAEGQDERTYYKPLREWINAHGGVAGRKLEIVEHELRIGSAQPLDAQWQAACSTFTDDNKVFIMMTQNEIGWKCAQDHGTVALGARGAIGSMFAKYPMLIDPTVMKFERIGSLTVGGLDAQNYFTGWSLRTRQVTKSDPKVGIVSWDDPTYRYSMEHGWLPALRALGINPRVAWVKVPDEFSGLGSSSAAVSNAVLRFQSDNIDHVLLNDGPAGVFAGTGLTFLFLRAAQGQRYFPRYGFNSYNSPAWEQLPREQQRGMLAVSWDDTQPSDDVGWKPNPAREKCFTILRKAGVKLNDDISMTSASQYCDIFFLIDRVTRSTQQLSVAGFMAAATGLGKSYQSPVNYLTRLAPDQRDGVNGVRNSKYNTGCHCMNFTSDPYTPR